MSQRFSTTENDAIKAARTQFPNMSQRGLATKMYQSFNSSLGQGVQARSKAAIYGAIRTYDRNNTTGSTKVKATKGRKNLVSA